jgi:hypothetical protein
MVKKDALVEMHKLIVDGTVSLETFIYWIQEQEKYTKSEGYMDAYNEGYNQGCTDTLMRERG